MDFKIVSGTINAVILIIIGLIWLGIAVFLLRKKEKSQVYVLFFTIFYVYIYKVIDYTLLQFQSLLLIKQFVPGLMLRGLSAADSVNLIPLITLGPEDVKTSLLNVLLMMPFGFGLPFITNSRMKKVIAAGLLFSISIELMQFLTGLVSKMTFRIADVNDVIFNTAGAAAGYLLFAAFVNLYCRAARKWNMRAFPKILMAEVLNRDNEKV